MKTCPRCSAKLTESDINSGKCHHCHATVLGVSGVSKISQTFKPVDLDATTLIEDQRSQDWGIPGRKSKLTHHSDVQFEEDVHQAQLPGYEIKGEIGRGGCGKVFLAHEDDITRDVAMKTFSLKKGVATERMLAKFLDEACITAQLQHPGIVPIYRLMEDSEGRPCYSMRPVEGHSLAMILSRLRKGDTRMNEKFPLSRLMRIFHSVCQTIHYAHDRGVVHCDLKPGNVIVGEYGEVLVIDWGLARIIDHFGLTGDELLAIKEEKKEGVWAAMDRRVHLSRAAEITDCTPEGVLMGTPSYMPPEQAAGHWRDVDQQSDLWSLGVLLYEICTLKLPFRGKTVQELLNKIINEQPIDPMIANPNRRVPPQLADIVIRCLRRKKEDRYPNVWKMMEDVEIWLEGRAPWKQVVDLDFGICGDIGLRGWTTACGQWKISDGKMLGVGEENIIFLDTPVPRDVRVTIVARIREGCVGEISPILSAPSPKTMTTHSSLYGGYCVQFGADYNVKAKIAKNGADIVSVRASYVPGKWHTVVAERVGDLIRMSVDGQEMIKYRDFVPLSGNRAGIYCWGNGLEIKQVTISGAGVPAKISCLEVPNDYYNNGQFDAALHRYLRIAESHPGNEEGLEALFLAGKCCLEIARARRDGNGASLSAASERLLDDANSYFERIEGSFLGPLGYLGQSMVAEFRGQFELEARALAEAYINCPGFDTLGVIGDRLWERAYELCQKGDYNAMAYFAYLAADYSPAMLGSSSMLFVVFQLPDKERAREIFRRILESYRHNVHHCVRALIMMIKSYRDEGRYDEALESIARLLCDYTELRRTCADGLVLEGLTRKNKGDYDGAEATLLRVLTEYADDRQSCANALEHLGSVQIYQGQYSAARESFNRILNEYSDLRDYCSWAKMKLGRCLMLEGDFEQARRVEMQMIQEYFEQRLPVTQAYRTLGDIWMAQGKYEQAAEAYWNAVRLYNEKSSVFLRAVAIRHLGRREDAIEIIRRLAGDIQGHSVAVTAAKIVAFLDGGLASGDIRSEVSMDQRLRSRLMDICTPILYHDRAESLTMASEWLLADGHLGLGRDVLGLACSYKDVQQSVRQKLRDISA